MKLAPTEAPGRVTRKARQFEAEIARLRAQGYTLAAICRFLATAGVHVNVSTVRREANRQAAAALSKLPPLGVAARIAPSPSPRQFGLVSAAASAVPSVPAAALPGASSLDPSSAKDMAEAFARTQTTNPLVRAKEQP